MKGLRVVLVEDNLMNRMLARDVLRHRGHAVTEAENVEQGWEAIARQRPDVALIDIDLPGGGGVELLTRIRAEPQLADLPCVAVTAFAMCGDRERLLAAGFDAYISKPIDTRSFPDEVLQIVRRCSGGDSTRGAA